MGSKNTGLGHHLNSAEALHFRKGWTECAKYVVERVEDGSMIDSVISDLESILEVAIGLPKSDFSNKIKKGKQPTPSVFSGRKR